MEYPILTPAQLAVHLRSLRKASSLTQAELGAKLGVNQARIGKIERDPRSVSVGQLLKILTLLGVRLVLQTTTADADAVRDAKPPGW
ncbi:MAG TPA: helix-turn-helix domain-containing protein [Steroidobacteraceae bacterium]|nr:helix-turn-helix domain-containing protein [Steroidobacteraceae bacterium]